MRWLQASYPQQNLLRQFFIDTLFINLFMQDYYHMQNNGVLHL